MQKIFTLTLIAFLFISLNASSQHRIGKTKSEIIQEFDIPGNYVKAGYTAAGEYVVSVAEDYLAFMFMIDENTDRCSLSIVVAATSDISRKISQTYDSRYEIKNSLEWKASDRYGNYIIKKRQQKGGGSYFFWIKE